MDAPRSAYLLRNEEVVAKVLRATYQPLVNGIEVVCEGALYISQAQLYFRSKDSDGVLVAIPHGALERVRKVSGKEKAGQDYVVELACKDLRLVRFGFPGKMQYKQTVTALTTFAYELEIPHLFAFRWKAQDQFVRWSFDIRSEYERCELAVGDHRLSTINQSYTTCDSYPQLLAVPREATDALLTSVAAFRSRGRLPVATYKYACTGAALYRCSQPLVGLKNTRCEEDEQLLALMASLPARAGSGRVLHIMDARPKVAAVGNKFLGAGMEHVGPGSRYELCTLEYMKIGNIHTMRDSLLKLMEALDAPERKQAQAIESSHWKDHISRIFEGAVRITQVLSGGNPVLVHCTDGWDRTAQLTCLTELMLDPYYRTLEGFAILVEKEWLAFGHKFAQRHGHGTFSPKFKDTQRAPIFLQFIDCTWQLMQQFPTSFQWNERFLLVVLDAVYGCVFGTFLCNTDQERRRLYNVIDQTTSVWSYVLTRRVEFVNPLFDAKSTENLALASCKLTPKMGEQHLQVWRGLYCRYRFTSLNDLDGFPIDTPRLSVININSSWNRSIIRTHNELHSSAKRPALPALPPALSLPVATESAPAISLPSPPRHYHRKASVAAASAAEPHGSVTLDSIEGHKSKRLSVLLNPTGAAPLAMFSSSGDESDTSEEGGGGGGVGDGGDGGGGQEGDEEESLETVNWTEEGRALSPAERARATDSVSYASAVDGDGAGDSVLQQSLGKIDARRPEGSTGMTSPRQNAAKRHGVKLSADEIAAAVSPGMSQRKG